MPEMEMNPRLRVAPMPVEISGQRMLIFQDPERITEQTVLMPLEAAVIVQYFDGNHSLRQIQEELMRQAGELVDLKLIQDVVDQLDEHLLLESPRFQAHLRQLNQDWMAQKVRPAYHAGSAYPADPAELTKFLENCYASPDGPGALPGTRVADDLKGIVAPHLDLKESGPCVARAFKLLAERTAASLFVILGVGHMEADRMFVLCDKDFDTPLGPVPADRELIARITRRRQDRNPLYDYVHKQEHSVEFMAVFLKHALRDRKDLRIVPVLCSGFTPNLAAQVPPEQDPVFRDFIGALKAALAERGEPVCFIAGADLAHLGPRYGDRESYAPIRMSEEETTDRQMLEPLLTGHREGFFREIARIKDQRRICGTPAIYALMAASGAARGDLVKWSYWHDRDTNSVVTYAAMALY